MKYELEETLDDSLKRAVKFFAEELGIHNASSIVYVSQKLFDGRNYGIVTHKRCIISNSYNHHIKISKLSKHKMFLTLAHEMIHVEQVTKQLYVKQNTHFQWKGNNYSLTTAYKDMPWERDALVRQDALLSKFLIVEKSLKDESIFQKLLKFFKK